MLTNKYPYLRKYTGILENFLFVFLVCFVFIYLKSLGSLYPRLQMSSRISSSSFLWIYCNAFKTTCLKCDNVMFDGESSKRAILCYLVQNRSFFPASTWMQFQNGSFKYMKILNETFLSLLISVNYLDCVYMSLTIIFKFKLGGIRYLFSPCSFIIIVIWFIFIRFIFMPYHCEKLSASLFSLKVVLLLSAKILEVMEYIVQNNSFLYIRCIWI